MNFLSVLMVLTPTFILSVLYHETGHYFALAKYIGCNPKIRYENGRIKIGKKTDYNKLSVKQRRTVYVAGVVLGLIPILFIGFVQDYLAFFVLLPYAFGSLQDVKYVVETFKEVRF